MSAKRLGAVVRITILGILTAGLYGALSPLLVKGMLGVNTPLICGLALFVLAACGGLSVLVLQHREPKEMMMFGVASLFVGVAIAVLSLPYNAIAWFFVGTMIAGVGFGAGFQGAVRTVVPFAAPHERAGVLSIIFIISYIAMGVPAVAAGWLIARHGNILATAQIFGAVIMAPLRPRRSSLTARDGEGVADDEDVGF